MCNDLGRLQTRFLGEPESLARARSVLGEPLDAERSQALGLVTFAYDDIDWEDEVRIFLEERASFSADALVGLEANLRFAGPETMETKIFGRLSAWQNWIFQRPSAVGERGALRRYGTGKRGEYSLERI
jgi:benzoyl-CoA-dihydrodiol lyase